ncbi:MAG TPA: hypothetical protein VHG71_05110 [Verrucomicrobiae bacterium]|nr:hypothetical protein [Verrucomicrobiae bacterium]
MNSADAEALMLLVAHMLALGVGAMVFLWMIYLHRHARRLGQTVVPAKKNILSSFASGKRPAIWLAVRSLESEIVRSMLSGQGKFFVSPRVNGWVIVTGPDLPHPDDDVDACYHFLIAISRELGHVQFFYAEKFSAHHAWARLDEGCVTRAFAWAGETVWNQGQKTLSEVELGLKCNDYGDDFENPESTVANVAKVPALAARWSIDPVILHRGDGIAGESSRLY